MAPHRAKGYFYRATSITFLHHELCTAAERGSKLGNSIATTECYQRSAKGTPRAYCQFRQVCIQQPTRIWDDNLCNRFVPFRANFTGGEVGTTGCSSDATLGFNRSLTKSQEFPNIDSYREIKVLPQDPFPSLYDHPVMVASKIVSKSFGSCKMVNIVWLGLPRDTGDSPGEVDPRNWPAMIDALQKVRKDINQKKLQGKAYVNISQGFNLATFPVTKDMMTSMTEAVKGVTKLDALVIMSAGNDGKPIRTYPQILGQTNPRVVVTGGVDSAGNIYTRSSTANFIKINAVSVNTQVIGSDLGSPGPLTRSGHLSVNVFSN